PDVDAFLRAEDDELLPYDCAATAVHAQRLRAVGILDDGELADVETRLATIADEGAAYLGEYEDVHSASEGLLGPVGRQIHAGRDFALDYLYASTVLFTHLSRIGEEIVLWCTSEFGFVRLPESASTGSSMMPQKLNPDVAELARGKAGTAIGRLTGLLAVVKGLPLAYDRDLQEDKEPLFATRRDVRTALAALATLVGGLDLDRERLANAVADPLPPA